MVLPWLDRGYSEMLDVPPWPRGALETAFLLEFDLPSGVYDNLPEGMLQRLSAFLSVPAHNALSVSVRSRFYEALRVLPQDHPGDAAPDSDVTSISVGRSGSRRATAKAWWTLGCGLPARHPVRTQLGSNHAARVRR